MDFVKGGKGLKLIWAAFVLDKHRVQTWTDCRPPRVRRIPYSIGTSMSSSATLAIVDDDQPFADYLQTMLRSRGYETLTYRAATHCSRGCAKARFPT